VYKRQIYQIAEWNRIETFFCPNWNALPESDTPETMTPSAHLVDGRKHKNENNKIVVCVWLK